MSSVESRFDEYLSKYAQFAENRQQMTEYSSHEALVNDQLEKKTAERQQKLRELGVLEQRAERQRRELSGYKTIYAQSSGLRRAPMQKRHPLLTSSPMTLLILSAFRKSRMRSQGTTKKGWTTTTTGTGLTWRTKSA